MAEALFSLLVLEPEAIAHGQLWRLWTGHLAHVSLGHGLGNLLALAILLWLSPARWTRSEMFALLVLTPPILSLAVLALRPDIAWYAGLSAITHLLLTRHCLLLSSGWKWLALGLLAAKLVAEAMRARYLGPAEVLTEAHWAGVALGLLFGLAGRTRPEPAFRPG